MHMYTLFAPYSSSYVLSLPLPQFSLVPAPTPYTGPVLPSCFPIL
jgi:hypothetical protein